MTGSVLGQWDVATGWGFTSPAQARWCWSSTVKGLEVELVCHHRTCAFDGQKQASAPGTALADMAITHTTTRGRWALEFQNAFNRLGSTTSAYRALGLVAQGRWIQLRFTTDLKDFEHNNKINLKLFAMKNNMFPLAACVGMALAGILPRNRHRRPPLLHRIGTA